MTADLVDHHGHIDVQDDLRHIAEVDVRAARRFVLVVPMRHGAKGEVFDQLPPSQDPELLLVVLVAQRRRAQELSDAKSHLSEQSDFAILLVGTVRGVGRGDAGLASRIPSARRCRSCSILRPGLRDAGGKVLPAAGPGNR